MVSEVFSWFKTDWSTTKRLYCGNFEGGLVTKQQYRFIIGLNETFLVWTPPHKVAELDNHYHSKIQGGKKHLNW